MSGFEEKIKGNLKQLLTSFYDETVGEELKAAVKALINDKKYNKEMEAYKNQHDDFDYDFIRVSVFLYECVLNGRFKLIFDKSDDENEMQELYNNAIAYANCAGNREEEEKVKKYCNHIYSFFKKELKSTYSDADNTLLNKQDYIAHTERDTFKYVKDIKDKIFEKEEPKYNTSNDIYINSFKTPLFLHKKNPDVVLSNLFVFQKYNDGKDDLQKRLGNFIQSDSHVLIIEGDAGNGKSSLVGWMNYHYNLGDNDSKSMFGDKKLVTIRLRDLNKESIRKRRNLHNALFEFVGTKNLSEFKNAFENSVVVLDGYDELCMIMSDTEYSWKSSMLEELKKFGENLKFIVTSRPHYININLLRMEYDSIYLNHFDEQKRDEWIGAYTDKCRQTIAPNVLNFIKHIDKKHAEGVCDTPFSLYMLAANQEMSEQVLNNSWALYHKIFYSEISETPYDDMYSDFGGPHSIINYRETIYQINEEIAYEMYKNNSGSESVFFLNDSKVKEIVRRVAKNKNCTDEDVKNLTEGSFALCCYWKNDAEDGAIEFYHNNIRDFFVCEKIFRELNKLYGSDSSDKLSDEEIQTFIDKFCELFLYGGLADKVMEFIGLRTEYGIKNNKNDFPKAEQAKKYLPQFFEVMLTNGGRMNCVNSNNPFQAIINTLRCVAQVYRSVYRRYLNENEKIHWWDSVDKVNKNGMLPYIFKPVFGVEGYLNVCSLDFREVDLENCDLSYAILPNQDFSNSNLSNSDLNNSVLYKAQLINAVLQGANLQGADLQKADLRDADLQGVDLRGANLQGANLQYADLRGADLEDVDLFYADLTNADLSNANLREANLMQANLTKAKLQGADLTGADLRGAKSLGANLTGAKLDGTILSKDKIDT